MHFYKMDSELFSKWTRISYAFQVLGWNLENWDPLKGMRRLPCVDLLGSGRNIIKIGSLVKKGPWVREDPHEMLSGIWPICYCWLLLALRWPQLWPILFWLPFICSFFLFNIFIFFSISFEKWKIQKVCELF